MKDGLLKICAASPNLKVCDCNYNVEQILVQMHAAQQAQVQVLCLPQLCLTGITCGDLFLQKTLLDGAQRALSQLMTESEGLDMLITVGLPVDVMGRIYNCVAVIQGGMLLGVVPKTHITGAQARWFSSAQTQDEVSLCGQIAPFGSDLLFACPEVEGLLLSIEVGDDFHCPIPPSALAAQHGATVILHAAGEGDFIGAAARENLLLSAHSARFLCAVVSAGAGEGESSTDQLYAGNCVITEAGEQIAQTQGAGKLCISEVDISRLVALRRKRGEGQDFQSSYRVVSFHFASKLTQLTRYIPQNPYLSEEKTLRAQQCAAAIDISAKGLAKRMRHTNAKCAIVGLSGGLDSTLAILIMARTMQLMERENSDLLAVTMPCFGTTSRTLENAKKLAACLNVPLREIHIGAAVTQHFKDIGHSMDTHDATFENAQARERTQVLMDIANQTGGIVVGTGDLSEFALGWATYNGDHMSMYGVNSSIPKTMVSILTAHIADTTSDGALRAVLRDILNTPVSPELLPAKDDKISQITEHLVGPYQLHDFFLYHTVVNGATPRKVYRFAAHAFAGVYEEKVIHSWLCTFYRRFFSQQFKRSCSADGVQVSAVSLSPRGGWVMPSDAMSCLWLKELEEIAP